MTPSQYLDTHGEPKDWALAVAITEQIESYRRAACYLVNGPPDPPKVRLSSLMRGTKSAEEWKAAVLDQARERVSRPVVDVEKARRAAADIAESGGWGDFVPGLADPLPCLRD